ncbi:RlpA-like double-psi beta-barrel-containing domain containing protein, partial [Russula decolorans]
WGQKHSGTASFTVYSGCSAPSCGIKTSGYTAAVNTFAFGANSASGDACGRCFKITSNKDPYTPSYSGPFNSIVVRVSNLCPIDGNQEWCGQTASHPVNQFGASMHFDLCGDSGTGSAFFPPGRGAMLGTFEEVLCEGNWSGSEGGSLWGGSCMANDTTPLWPGRGCGNQGT